MSQDIPVGPSIADEQDEGRLLIPLDGAGFSMPHPQEDDLRTADTYLFWTTNPDGLVEDIPFYRAFTGQTAAEVAGWGWLQALHPDDQPGMAHRWRQAVERKTPLETECRLRRADGVYRHFAVQGIPLCHPDGTVREWVGVCTDITERRHAEHELRDRAHETALAAAIGRALTSPLPLQERLQQCTAAVVQHLDAAFARIWTLHAEAGILELQASAGIYTHLDGGHSHVPLGSFKIGRIAQLRMPHLTNHVLGDGQVHDQEWARREGMVAFAGYPLITGDAVVGVLALFARHPLSARTLSALGAIADEIALAIEQAHTQEHREQLLVEVEATRTLFEAVLQQLPTGVIIMEAATGRILLSNAQVNHILGHPHRSQEEKKNTSVPGGSALSSLADGLLATILAKSEVIVDQEIPYQRSDGKLIILSTCATPVRDQHGTIVANVVTFTDITARIQQEQERAHIVSVVSHELKTPLTSAQAMLQVIRRRLARGKAVEDRPLEQVEHSIHRMERLVNDLLDATRVETEQLALELASYDIRTLCEQAVEEQMRMTDRTITMALPTQPLLVHADANRVLQILHNILSNALKYSAPETSVMLTARQQRKQRQRMAYVAIRDQGPGITPEALPHLFERFYRAPGVQVLSGSGVGLGLGLYLCRRLLERQNGAIGIESVIGQGTTVWFTLPLASSENYS